MLKVCRMNFCRQRNGERLGMTSLNRNGASAEVETLSKEGKVANQHETQAIGQMGQGLSEQQG
jgi:hypothetical protein